MLTSDQLNSLLIVNESDRLKFTTATDYTDKFSQAVCAFANDFSNSRKPGFLLIGVDGKGRPSGMKVTDKLLQNLGTILPLPSMEVYSVGLEGGDIAVEEVHPSDLPPVRYKGQVWIRVGPRKAIASDHEERILTEKRIARVTSFDVSPVREASLADLSLPIFHEYRQSVIDKDILERNHRTIEEQLAGLRFFDLALNVPTIAGILLFGKNPRYFLSGNYIQYLRLPGKVLTEVPVDQTETSGNLLTVLRELDLRLKAGIRTWLRFISPYAGEADLQLSGGCSPGNSPECRPAPGLPVPYARALLLVFRSNRNPEPRRALWGGDKGQSDATEQLPQPGYCRSDEIVGVCQPFRLRDPAGTGCADGK